MIRFAELKDPNTTFDVAKLRCIRDNDVVQIIKGTKVIGQFNPPKGDWEEVQVGPMKNTLASLLAEKVFEALPNAGDVASYTRRQKTGLLQTMVLLKGFEERGGKL